MTNLSALAQQCVEALTEQQYFSPALPAAQDTQRIGAVEILTRELSAFVAETQQREQELISRAVTSERFRSEDGMSHVNEQIAFKEQLDALKAKLAETQQELRDVMEDRLT